MTLKKLIAAAAASLPLVASAQQAAPAAAAPAPLYQWYGTLNLNGQYIEASDPTNPVPGVTPVAGGRNMTGRLAISTDSTNIGIRGTADLGDGLGVVYQCESSAFLDGETSAGICGRNSRLGLSSNFGTLFYGNWDTPYKAVAYGTKADDPFGNTDVYDAAAIIGSPGLKTRATAGRTAGAGAPQASFAVRAANSIAYHSPKFEGFQVKAQYSVNEYQTRAGDIAPALYSVSGNFDSGMLSVFLAYERHDDWAGAGFGATQTTVDQGVKGGAGVEIASGFGTTTVGVQVDYLMYAVENPGTAVGAFDNASRMAYQIGLKHRTGNHEFRARFSQALESEIELVGGASAAAAEKDTGAMMYTLGYGYYLSKAAQVYVYGTKLENDDAASYTFATAGPASLTAAAPNDWTAGSDLFAAGVGLRYAF